MSTRARSYLPCFLRQLLALTARACAVNRVVDEGAVIRIRSNRNAFVTCFFTFVACGLLACGGDKPPARLPSTAARDRVATRVELVDLVISDPERARKVRSLYVAMDSLLL